MTAPDRLDEDLARFTETVETVKDILFVGGTIVVFSILAWWLA